MAQLAGVFGTSHSPALITPVPDWPALEPRIARPARAELAGRVREAWDEHQTRFDRAMEQLRDAVLAVEPDVLLIVGSDQGENFGPRSAPVFELFLGDRVEASAADRRGEGPEQFPVSMPVAGGLGHDVLKHLCATGFDVAHVSETSHEYGIGHAITWPLRFLGLRDSGLQLLPLVTNVWNLPNVPGVSRCVAFGQALREAIEASAAPLRVAVIASGGLSHLVLDEDLDARVLTALRSPGTEAWQAIGDDELAYAHERHGLSYRLNGTSEITDWIIADACAGTAAEVIDYVPAYRTESGYGVGMCFARWSLPAG
ncbi:DODA-type extradiol aromatic ring-opening family dioxygenase [Streptomyces sp. NPDC055078]